MSLDVNLSNLLNNSFKPTDSEYLDSLTQFVDDADQLFTIQGFADTAQGKSFLSLSQQLQGVLQFDDWQKKQISLGEIPAAQTVVSVVKKYLPALEQKLEAKSWILTREAFEENVQKPKTAEPSPLIRIPSEEQTTKSLLGFLKLLLSLLVSLFKPTLLTQNSQNIDNESEIDDANSNSPYGDDFVGQPAQV
jgi:hypothetical protein